MSSGSLAGGVSHLLLCLSLSFDLRHDSSDPPGPLGSNSTKTDQPEQCCSPELPEYTQSEEKGTVCVCVCVCVCWRVQRQIVADKNPTYLPFAVKEGGVYVVIHSLSYHEQRAHNQKRNSKVPKLKSKRCYISIKYGILLYNLLKVLKCNFFGIINTHAYILTPIQRWWKL